MPYKPFEPKDTLEACLTKLWGDSREVNPTTRLEEIILKIAEKQPTGIHAVPDITEADEGKVLTVENGEAVWAECGGGGSSLADTVFPMQASVTYNQSGLAEGRTSEFTSSFGIDSNTLVAIYDTEYSDYPLMNEWMIAGTTTVSLIILSYDSENGLYLAYDSTKWAVTVSGNAEVVTDDDAHAVHITGDCTINAEYIGT